MPRNPRIYPQFRRDSPPPALPRRGLALRKVVRNDGALPIPTPRLLAADNVDVVTDAIVRALLSYRAGLLYGLSFALFYVIVALPIARLADRSNRRNIIAAGVTVWSAPTARGGRIVG